METSCYEFKYRKASLNTEFFNGWNISKVRLSEIVFLSNVLEVYDVNVNRV